MGGPLRAQAWPAHPWGEASEGGQRPPPRYLGSFLVLAFFLSGASGLLYEVVWTRHLTLLLGTTALAVSTVLAAFMAGLGLGAWLFGRLVDRVGRAALTYGLLELGVAVSALVLPAILPGLELLHRWAWERFHPSFSAFSAIRFLLIFGLLLVPTTLMGGTLPVLVAHFARPHEGLGWRVGLLYGLNTLGAVLGAGATGFFLLPRLGMAKTTLLAVAVNAGIGLIAVAVGLRERRLTARQEEAAGALMERLERPTSPPVSRLQRWLVLGTAALSGFVALLAEVAWTRVLTLVLGSSTYAFTAMLVTFLLGLALGSLAMARLLRHLSATPTLLAGLQVGIGVAALVTAHLFVQLPLLYLHLYRAVAGAPWLLAAGQFLLAGLVMLPPTLLMGAVFPVAVLLARGPSERAGSRVGLVYAANTAGAVLGALGGSLLLLFGFGIPAAVTLGLALSLGAGLGLFLATGPRWQAAAMTAALLVALPILGPGWDPLALSSGVYKEAPLYLRLYRSPGEVFTRLLPRFRLRYYREGPTATVAVTERPTLEDRPHLVLAIDGKVDASSAGDMPTQLLSGHLPLLIHPQPERVLVVGLASGVTVGAVARHPVSAITVVEIEPAVVPASRLFDAFSGRPLDDPRVRLVLDDARTLLQVSPERYDVIISEPSNPWMSGPAKLFTREFFQIGRDRLRPGGLFVQWLQLYGLTAHSLKALLRTFQAAFPHLLVFQTTGGDLLLIGGNEPVRIPFRQIRDRLQAPAVARDLARIDVRDAYDLLTRFRLGTAEARRFAGGGPLNTDDNALIEFAAPREIHLETAAENAEALRRAGRGVGRYLTDEGKTAEERARVRALLAARLLAERAWQEAERAARQGLELAETADGLWVLGEALRARGQEADALRTWHRALNLAPPHYGARLSLARYHLDRGEWREAKELLSLLLGRYPEDPLVRFYAGLSLYRLGLYRSALGVFTPSRGGTAPAAAHGPDWMAALLHPSGPGEAALAEYFVHLAWSRLGQPERAQAAWDSFLGRLTAWRERMERQTPETADLSILDEVKARAERGGEFPEDPHLASALGRHVLEPLTHYYKGTTAYLLGYPEEAVAELERALALLGEEASRSRAHYFLGRAHWQLGQPDRARAHLREFLRHLDAEGRKSYPALEAARLLAAVGSRPGASRSAASPQGSNSPDRRPRGIAQNFFGAGGEFPIKVLEVLSARGGMALPTAADYGVPHSTKALCGKPQGPRGVRSASSGTGS